MKIELQSPVGLIAGNGRFPFQVAEELRQRGLRIVTVAHRSETDTDLQRLSDVFEWVKVGQLGAIIGHLKRHGVRQVAMAGGIRRVNWLGGLALDARALSMLTRLRSFRDDALLRGVAAELEASGIKLVSAAEIVSHSFQGRGLIAGPGLSEDQLRDARVGMEVACNIGSSDIGQTIVLHQGTVVAVEAVEGTDETLKRAGALLKNVGGVVVKFCKCAQDQRMDLPAIGPRTISLMSKLGLKVLVLEAGNSVILDPDETIARAKKAQISLCLVKEIGELEGLAGK